MKRGAKVLHLCRKHGISDATFYHWKAKYAGMTVADVHWLRELEGENRKLKRIVGDQVLDIAASKGLLGRTSVQTFSDSCFALATDGAFRFRRS